MGVNNLPEVTVLQCWARSRTLNLDALTFAPQCYMRTFKCCKAES